jgi:hypothetical protein
MATSGKERNNREQAPAPPPPSAREEERRKQETQPPPTTPGEVRSGTQGDFDARYEQLFGEGTGAFSGAGSLRALTDQYRNAGVGIDETQRQIKDFALVFENQFKNFVGRGPTTDEFDQFFRSVVMPAQAWKAPLNQTELRQNTSTLLSDFYSGAAEEEALNKSRRLASEAIAPGSAFDTWQGQYRQSLSDTEKSLADYQTRLFEKLRPQLLTSLQAQGLLNTGALNEAFAGASKDLSDEAQRYIVGARSAAEADIADRRYQIQSSPDNFALQNTFNAVPNLQAAGQNALQNVWGGIMQQKDFDNQMRLLERQSELQRSSRPSALSQYAGLILGGAAGGFASGLGQRGFLGQTPGMG